MSDYANRKPRKGALIEYGQRRLTITKIVRAIGGTEYHGTGADGKRSVITVPAWDRPEVIV